MQVGHLDSLELAYDMCYTRSSLNIDSMES